MKIWTRMRKKGGEKMDIKPIETIYNGYRFRSRLEARWAVFFDEIGAEYEYEPQGYKLSDGTLYLPDFLLKNVRGRGCDEMFVEIKGVLTNDDLHKIELFSGGYPIIIFGKIPDCTRIERHFVPCLNRYVGPWWEFDFDKDNDERYYNLEYSEGDYYWTAPKAAKGGGLVLDYPDNPFNYIDEDLTAKAYIAAKQARFEHGETPKVRR